MRGPPGGEKKTGARRRQRRHGYWPPRPPPATGCGMADEQPPPGEGGGMRLLRCAIIRGRAAFAFVKHQRGAWCVVTPNSQARGAEEPCCARHMRGRGRTSKRGPSRLTAPARPPPPHNSKTKNSQASDNIVENDSESRLTRPLASLSWRSRAAWPCHRLPRRHSRRSPRNRSRARHLVFRPRGAASWLRGRARTRSPPGTGRQGRRMSRFNLLQTPQACLSVVCV